MNTKIETEAEKSEVADVLGTSAVIINDLKQRRATNYEFSWDKALHLTGSSGIKLQYTHARLSSLLRNNNNMTTAAPSVYENLNYGSLLTEAEADQLVLRLAQYDETLAESYLNLEPSVLVKYLFDLCRDVGQAIHVLQVKGCESEELRLARLALFTVSRKTLAHGMSVLGLTPLNKM